MPMEFIIHFEWPDGTADGFVVTGDTIEEIREQAEEGVDLRNGKNPWSEEKGRYGRK